MREIIAVCRSTKKSRKRVASVLDCYFWRIGDRTWRGQATNACLDRVSRELRKRAARNTAVVIHEIRSARESRVPIIRIGAQLAFSKQGLVPVASHPSQFAKQHHRSMQEQIARGIVRIAALFHDLGKATSLFQQKLDRALDGAKPEADPIRHELFSASVWDQLFGNVGDPGLSVKLQQLTPEAIDAACQQVTSKLVKHCDSPTDPLRLQFLKVPGSRTYMIGMLILTHHRLPDGDSDLLTPLGNQHVKQQSSPSVKKQLGVHTGIPFWREHWWQASLEREAKNIAGECDFSASDIALRASLMIADHLGSASSKPSSSRPEHLANTRPSDSSKSSVPADSLLVHTRKVFDFTRQTFDLFYKLQNTFPALDASQIPTDILYPLASNSTRFQWQHKAAAQAARVCSESEGGFFACLMAGTGTGKTRGAPTILASAAIADTLAERRYLRFSLALGLRVLATQSATEYVDDLGFNTHDVAVIVGRTPLNFQEANDASPSSNGVYGSESLIDLPEWLRVEHAYGKVPEEGDSSEADWLKGLSFDSGRRLPAVVDQILKNSSKRQRTGHRLLSTPVQIGTIDHLMPVAAPLNSRYLIPLLRVATSDLIIDEIDQFNGEDLAAIGRLVYASASLGRRVIIMSATLSQNVASSLYRAYREGWSVHAKSNDISDHVNLLVSSDNLGSCNTNTDGRDFADVYKSSQDVSTAALLERKPLRRSRVMPPCKKPKHCENWKQLVKQIDRGCARLHYLNSEIIGNKTVSVGMVRMTRIAHTAALASQLPSGCLNGRLRVVVCLHSNFPRLIRDWIERRLGLALKRKGNNPNTGVESLCADEGLFELADKHAIDHIEIVVVTSPVIETGNDLDFDWAIVDPVSTRSVVQTAGRVLRHRTSGRTTTNILIIGQSPIVMEAGKLAYPGVETPVAKDTKVNSVSLDDCTSRDFKDLIGEVNFSTIDASKVVDPQPFPLRDKESELVRIMMNADDDNAVAPLGRFIRNVSSRNTRATFLKRKFRRSENKSIVYTKIGEDLDTSTWFVDLAPGTRHSELTQAEGFGLTAYSHTEFSPLFKDMELKAWHSLTEEQKSGSNSLRDIMTIETIDFERDEMHPKVVYSSFTGLTKGTSEDLFSPFGKSNKNQ